MPDDPSRPDDVRIITAAYEDRLKELFKVMAETVYTGEPERDAIARFRRALASAQRVYTIALDTLREDPKT
jgi:hypothetical protein